MRGFLTREIQAAVGYSLSGGQSLHLHTLGVGKDAPAVFRGAVARGEWVAHLFDKDADRLKRTARALGVNVVVIDRPGQAAQHVDLCGGPLQRALLLCENAAELPTRPGAGRPLIDVLPDDELPPVDFAARHQNERPDFAADFGLPPELAGEPSGMHYAAAYEADRAARPTTPPRRPVRPPDEMRFGNMGPMARPTYEGTGADEQPE